MGINETIVDTRHWITEHKLKAIGQSCASQGCALQKLTRNQQNKLLGVSGGLWATGVVGSLGFQWSRPIPTQLKIIHSRVYAQVSLALLFAELFTKITCRCVPSA